MEDEDGQLGGERNFFFLPKVPSLEKNMHIGQLGGSRINLEEEARELTRLKEQVANKVSRRKIFGIIGHTTPVVNV